jgi:peroxiredoxin Q/BCP
MKPSNLRKIGLAALFCALPFTTNAAARPQVGDKAVDFALKTLDDQTIRLSDLTAKRPVVLIELRGWPGYQCPICSSQVHDYVKNASRFESNGVQVLMVYPGPASDLKAHATEFLHDKSWPDKFLFVLDPNYAFTNSYDLRWNAEHETAYPSAFIIDSGDRVRFAHISAGHADRVGADEALQALRGVK